jgi:hypothetical protein
MGVGAGLGTLPSRNAKCYGLRHEQECLSRSPFFAGHHPLTVWMYAGFTLSLRGATKKKLGLHAAHEQGLRQNNRYENAHLPVRRREHKQQRFKFPDQHSAF